MRRSVLIISAMSCLLAPIAAFAQPSGGTGNNHIASASASGPTIEDKIDVARQEIEKARDDKAISNHKADSEERKLRSVERQLEHLSRKVSQIRHSAP